ncbi:MAG: hypothetical protein F6K36_28775 [Symploca sp. SIO3C6]|nr:hypothetical protein [Symploca sp. SIO3C6]NET08589.1 hypothetical protein [Symploca sp. SIO2B6]NET52235.1 hypothetical protein [Merismopedia sp. SIO2A8]
MKLSFIANQYIRIYFYDFQNDIRSHCIVIYGDSFHQSRKCWVACDCGKFERKYSNLAVGHPVSSEAYRVT